MKLSELIREVWKDERVREIRLRQDEVEVIVKAVVEHIGKGLIEYGKMKLHGLFTLELRKVKGRRISNPQTKEHMYSKDYYKIGVIPSKDTKEKLNDLEKDKS